MTNTVNERPGSLYWRAVDEHHEIVIYPMTFGKVRLCFGTRATAFDDGNIEKGYCYENPGTAVSAAVMWDGEGDPLDGWHREVFSGRRRENGDPNKETVRA